MNNINGIENFVESFYCNICLTSDDSERVKTLCNHEFHKQCLLESFAAATGEYLCPNDRNIIPLDQADLDEVWHLRLVRIRIALAELLTISDDEDDEDDECIEREQEVLAMYEDAIELGDVTVVRLILESDWGQEESVKAELWQKAVRILAIVPAVFKSIEPIIREYKEDCFDAVWVFFNDADQEVVEFAGRGELFAEWALVEVIKANGKEILQRLLFLETLTDKVFLSEFRTLLSKFQNQREMLELFFASGRCLRELLTRTLVRVVKPTVGEYYDWAMGKFLSSDHQLESLGDLCAYLERRGEWDQVGNALVFTQAALGKEAAQQLLLRRLMIAMNAYDEVGLTFLLNQPLIDLKNSLIYRIGVCKPLFDIGKVELCKKLLQPPSTTPELAKLLYEHSDFVRTVLNK
jgi:hypothetical protein